MFAPNRKTLAAKINDIRAESKVRDIVGDGGVRAHGGTGMKALRNKRSPLSNVRGVTRSNSSKRLTGVAPATNGGLKPTRPSHGSPAPKAPRRGKRRSSVAFTTRAAQQEQLDKLMALNDHSGSPPDEATEVLTEVGNMLELADELKGRIATSYNSSAVKRRLKGLVPKISNKLLEGQSELVRRADRRLRVATEDQAKLESYVTVQLDNDSLRKHAESMQKVATLIRAASSAKVKAKSQPHNYELSKTYIVAVEAIRVAIRQAGASLTAFAATAIREALQAMAKAQRKLYKLKARVMKRTPRETDDYERHFPQVATADKVINTAQEARLQMEANADDFDFAQAFITAANACPRAVDAAALAVQKRAISEAVASMKRSDLRLTEAQKRLNAQDSAVRKQQSWTTVSGEGTSTSDAQWNAKATSNRDRLTRSIEAASAMAQTSVEEAAKASAAAHTAHQAHIKASGKTFDTKAARAFVKGTAAAGQAAAAAFRRVVVRETAILAATRNVMHTSHLWLRELRDTVKSREQEGEHIDTRVRTSVASAESALKKAKAANSAVERSETVGAAEDSAGAASGAAAMFGNQVIGGGAASALDTESGRGNNRTRRASVMDGVQAKFQAHDDLLAAVDVLYTSVTIAADAMRSVRLTAAGRELKRSQQRLAAVERQHQDAGSPPDAAKDAIDNARQGIEDALLAKQKMSAAPDAPDLVETFILFANNTTARVARAEQALQLRAKEELAKEVEASSKLMAVVRAEMDQLELMHRSLGDSGTSVAVQELVVALRLGEQVDTMQSELMSADADSPDRDAKCRAFVATVRRLESSVQDAELALRSLSKRRAMDTLTESLKELETLERRNRADGQPRDAATEALEAAQQGCRDAEQAQRQLNADPRSKAAAAAFIKSATYTVELVARVREGLDARYHRNLNAEATECVQVLIGLRADVEQLQFMHRLMLDRNGIVGVEDGTIPELTAALHAVDVAERSAATLREMGQEDDSRWEAAEQFKVDVANVNTAVERADASIRGMAKTHAVESLEKLVRQAAELERQVATESNLPGEGPAKAIKALRQGIQDAEEARRRMKEAEKAFRKSGRSDGGSGAGSGNGSGNGNGGGGIDRGVARSIDEFVQAVHAAEPLVAGVHTAVTGRRKDALDHATSSAFAAFRYLRAGVDGLATRVKAANMRQPPPEVVAAQTAAQTAEQLQEEMKALPDGEERDALARRFIAALPNVQTTGAQATQVLNKRDANVVKAAAGLLRECQTDVDSMRDRNQASGAPFDEASKLVDAAAALVASCSSMHTSLTAAASGDRRASMTLSMSVQGQNLEMKRAQAALAMRRQSSANAAGALPASLTVLDPTRDKSFAGNAYDTTAAVRFAAQVTSCHEACNTAAEAVKRRDVQRFNAKFAELETARDELPSLHKRVAGLAKAVATAIAQLKAGGAGVGGGAGGGDSDGDESKAGDDGDDAPFSAAVNASARSTDSTIIVRKGKEEMAALKGVPSGLVETLLRCRTEERKAEQEVKEATEVAVKAVATVPSELTTLQRDRVRGRRKSAGSTTSGDTADAPHNLLAGVVGGSPNKAKRLNRHGSNASIASSVVSMGGSKRALSRTASLASMAAAAFTLKDYNAEAGDAACEATDTALHGLNRLRHCVQATDAALLAVVEHCTKQMSATAALMDMTATREERSREQAKSTPGVEAAPAQAAVQAGKLNVVAAQGVGKEMQAEIGRVSDRVNGGGGRRGRNTGRRRSRVRRRSVLTATSSVVEASVAVSPSSVVAVNMESDIRTTSFRFATSTRLAVDSVARAVEAVDAREAAILTATKQRLGGEVLEAGEKLAVVEKGLRQLQEHIQAAESSRGRDKAATQREVDACAAVEELGSAVTAATALRAKVLANTSMGDGDNGGGRVASRRGGRRSSANATTAALTDESAFSDAEQFVASVEPCEELLKAAAAAVSKAESERSASSHKKSTSALESAERDAEFLHSSMPMYRELAKRTKRRDVVSRKHAAPTATEDAAETTADLDASLQAVVTQVNLACQVVADALEAQDRVRQHLSLGGGFGSAASVLAAPKEAESQRRRAAVAATAQLAAFNRLAEEATQAVGKAADMMQEHASSVISSAVEVLDNSQAELETLQTTAGDLQDASAATPLTDALDAARTALEGGETSHASLLRWDEVGDWQGVVRAAPEFADRAADCVAALAAVRDTLAVRQANVTATLQRADELLAQLEEAMKELHARARVLTVGSEDVRCRVERSEGIAALQAAKDAMEEARARQKDVRSAKQSGGTGKSGPTVATLERRFAEAVPRAAASIDAAVDAIAQEEELLRAFSATLVQLTSTEAELESILELYEHNGALKANQSVKAAVEAAIEEMIQATTLRDELCIVADQSAEVALHGKGDSGAGTGAGAGANGAPPSAIVAVLPAMPEPTRLQALVSSIQRTAPLVHHAYEIVLQQLRGKDVVIRTMLAERKKAEILLERTSVDLEQSRGVAEEKLLGVRGDAQTMLAAQSRRNDAIKAVDRAIQAVTEAMSSLHSFDESPVPTVSDLVTLSAAVSDAKVFADFAYELVGEVTNPTAAAKHARTRGVRVLQRSRALIQDAGNKVKEGIAIVTKLQRHTAFNIAVAECETTLQAATEIVTAADRVYHVAKRKFQDGASAEKQAHTKNSIDELEFLLIDSVRAGVMAAISSRVIAAVKNHFNGIVTQARQQQQ